MTAYDIKITGAQLHDGSGAPGRIAELAIKDGVIAAIGEDLGPAEREIDGAGCILTPGFIDIHTHYDGQASWDGELRPSVEHGVTTAVMGNCGVGFAPCRAEDRGRLIKLMEGVEDIPGTALHEGISWSWESFPEYLDALAGIQRTIDIAAMVPHDPLRVYVMGDRAVYDEPASEADIDRMRALTREALQAGAVGFATGRSDLHKSADGDWTPASEATSAELAGIAKAFEGLNFGVVQAVSDFNLERGPQDFDAEWRIIEAYAKSAGRPFSFSLMQRDFAPDQWKQLIEGAERLKAEGVDARMQVAPRAIGVFLGLQATFHPFMGYPSYKSIADLPLAERVAKMRDPDFRKQILSEKTDKLSGPGSSIPPIADLLMEHIEFAAGKFFQLGDPPDYEQPAERSLAAQAKAEGLSVMEKIYDVLLERDGHELIYLPIYNYTELSYDNVLTMMRHPQALYGLSDGGAHVGTVCDASFPTYLLSYWTRDRQGERIGLPEAVRMLTGRQADFMGMTDRGYLRAGMKADVTLIDLDALTLGAPYMVEDLPAGGRRLLQGATGYRATLVAGVPVIENDQLTGARPGALYRAGQDALEAAQ